MSELSPAQQAWEEVGVRHRHKLPCPCSMPEHFRLGFSTGEKNGQREMLEWIRERVKMLEQNGYCAVHELLPELDQREAKLEAEVEDG